MVQASIYIMPYPYSLSTNEAGLRSQFSLFQTLGLNCVMAGWDWLGIETWRDGNGIEVVIDMIYNIAAEYDIKIFWYTSVHRIPWINPDTGETFVARYKNFSACAGWLVVDEPALMGLSHNTCKDAYNLVKSIDSNPNHPVHYVWSADLDTTNYMHTMHPAWGDLYDISSEDIYGRARAGDNWRTFLADTLDLMYNYTNSAPYWGFEHWQPRDHLSVIQAWIEGGVPDIVGQYDIVKNGLDDWVGWGDKLIGIGLFSFSLSGGNSDLESIRQGVKDLAMSLGWIPEIKLSGSVSFEKSLTLDVFTRTVRKLIYGSLALTGSLSEHLFYPLFGSLNFVGVSVKKLFSNLFGSLSLSGDIDTPFWETFYKTCGGAISFSQTLSQKVKNTCGGAISFSQTLSQKVKAAFFSLLDFMGLLYIFSGGDALSLLTFSEIQDLTYTSMQTYTYGLHYTLRLGGLLSFSAITARKIETYFSGAFSFSGSLLLKAKAILSGALTPEGTFVNAVKIAFSGSLTYSGIVKRAISNFILTGVLSPFGNVIKSGYASFVDLIRRLIQLFQVED